MPPRFAHRFAVAVALLLAAVAGATPSASAQKPGKRATTPGPSAATSAAPSASASPTPVPYVLPETVAVVNGEPIKQKDVERLALLLAGNSGKTVQDLPTADQKQAYASVVDSLIIDKLASKEAAGQTVEDIDVEKRYNDFLAQYPSRQAFDEQVRKSGQTTDQIKANVRGQLAQQQWLEAQIASEIKVTPLEVEKYYRESAPNKLDVPEMVHARHILVKARKDATPEDALVAEQKAAKLAARLKTGEKFEDVARRESDDPTARDVPAAGTKPAVTGNGGDIGWFTRDRIMPQFGDVAFKMSVGEVSGPVRTQFGYHLIQVLDRKAAHTATLDEARDQITAFLQAEKRQKAIATLVQGLRDKAKVEVFLP